MAMCIVAADSRRGSFIHHHQSFVGRVVGRTSAARTARCSKIIEIQYSKLCIFSSARFTLCCQSSDNLSRALQVQVQAKLRRPSTAPRPRHLTPGATFSDNSRVSRRHVAFYLCFFVSCPLVSWWSFNGALCRHRPGRSTGRMQLVTGTGRCPSGAEAYFHCQR
eukprot:5283875-Pleurochrysis_carterae.AAC.1